MGGTFNPIHNGHLWLVQEFSRRLALDTVVLIPTKQPTHKQALELAGAGHRLAMCRLAAEPLGCRVSDVEIRRASDSYTVFTLRQLRREFPRDRLYLLMGEDMFLTLTQWKEPQEIFSMATLCVSPRSSQIAGMERLRRYAGELREWGADSLVLDIPHLPVSSTEIRRAIRQGNGLERLVPPAVADYIVQHALYQEDPNGNGFATSIER